MRLGVAVVDQAFHAAEAGCHCYQLHVADDAVGGFAAVVFQVNRYHAAAAFGHLPPRQFVVLVRGQAGVEHFFDGGVRFEAAGDGERVGAVPLHAQGEGFDAAQHEGAVGGAGHAAGVHQHGVQGAGEFGVFHRHHAHQHVGVAAQVFGGRVEHDVAAHIQRLLQIGRGEGVVDAHQRAGGFGFGRQNGDVHQPQQRVGRRFQPHQLHVFVFRQRLIQIGRVGEVGKHHVHAPGRVHFGEQIVAAAVDVADGNNRVARAQKGAEHAVDARHAAAEGEARRAVFQRGHRVFQHLARRVGQAGVAEGNLLADALHGKH